MNRSYQYHLAHSVNRCGLFAFATTRSAENHSILHLSKSRCKSYSCPRCRPQNMRRIRARFLAATSTGTWRFATLTIPVGSNPEQGKYQYLKDCWRRMSARLRKQYQGIRYIRMLDTGTGGNCHYHVLFDRYLPVGLLRSMWMSCGGGYIVDIRLIPAKCAGAYAVKYVTSLKQSRPVIEAILYETSSRRFSATNKTLPAMSKASCNLILRSYCMQTLFKFLVSWLNTAPAGATFPICSDISSAKPHDACPRDKLAPNCLLFSQPVFTAIRL